VRRIRALDPPAAHVSDRIVQRLLTAERRLGERLGQLFPEHDALRTLAMSQTRGVVGGHGPVALGRQPAISVPAVCRQLP
jgi:hypothetical protein